MTDLFYFSYQNILSPLSFFFKFRIFQGFLENILKRREKEKEKEKLKKSKKKKRKERKRRKSCVLRNTKEG
jgi:hypothetical protein